MISKEELRDFLFPEPIDFIAEENRLRSKNMKQLQDFLVVITKYPSIVDDYDNLSTTLFKRKYIPLTENENIHEDAKNFIIKITNYSNNFDLSRNYLIRKLQEDQALASNFIIDFKKQNPYEPFVENYFRFLDNKLHLINNFKHLPVSGPTAKYVYNGLICDASIKESVQETPPSVDFVWNYSFGGKTMNFYASHKYTHGEGTAQKNQMRDLETFLGHAIQSVLTNNNYFIAIMDGNYYTDFYYPNFNGNPKPKVIDHIRNTKQNTKCKVATSYDLVKIIIELIKCFLQNNFQPSQIEEELEKLNILYSKL